MKNKNEPIKKMLFLSPT